MGSVRFIFFRTCLFALLLLAPGLARAEHHVLVLAVEATADEERALAQLADVMLHDAVVETPGVSVIDWTPDRATVTATCQSARVDEACLDAVAARYHADYVIVPYIARHEDQNASARHVEARLFDAREGTLGDAACAVLENATDPDVALALVELLLDDVVVPAPEDEGVEIDAGEGRSLGGYVTLRFGDPASVHALSHQGRVPGLVPSTSPCDSLSVLAGPSASVLCHGARAPAPEALTIVDGAGPVGHAAAAANEDHGDHEGHDDIIDRMLERVRLSGRVSRSGLRLGAKIAF